MSGSATNAPNSIKALQDQITRLEGQLQQNHEEIADLKDGKSTTKRAMAKIGKPMRFNGNRTQLEPFLLQVEMYLEFNPQIENEADKAMTAISFMEGPALAWAQPYLRSWYDYDGSQQTTAKTERENCMRDFDKFKQAMKDAFGHVDEKLAAAQQIQRLRQTKSAMTYVSEFQRIAAVLEWDDGALTDALYRGFKDEVKDDIARIDPRPDTFTEMARSGIRIDNRLYERRMERKNRNFTSNSSRTRAPARKEPYDPYGPMPMELDATRRLDNKEKEQRKEKNQCFYCGKEGHYARNCHKKKDRKQHKLRATKGYERCKEARDGYDTTGVPKLRATKRTDDEEFEKSFEWISADEGTTDERPPIRNGWVDAGQEFRRQQERKAKEAGLTYGEHMNRQIEESLERHRRLIAQRMTGEDHEAEECFWEGIQARAKQNDQTIGEYVQSGTEPEKKRLREYWTRGSYVKESENPTDKLRKIAQEQHWKMTWEDKVFPSALMTA